jgi:cytidylate kinase
MNDMPLNQKVFLAQFESIKKLAAEGPCVIIGRCADYALEEDPNLLSVFIHADIDTRVRRIANIYGLKANKARDRIKKNDKSRSSYYNYYTSKEWGSVDSYDLSINSAKYGIEGAAELIINAVAIKEKGIGKSIVECKEE